VYNKASGEKNFKGLIRKAIATIFWIAIKELLPLLTT